MQTSKITSTKFTLGRKSIITQVNVNNYKKGKGRDFFCSHVEGNNAGDADGFTLSVGTWDTWEKE